MSIATTCRLSSGSTHPQLARNFGFRANELRTMQSMVTGHREEFLEAWHEFFGIGGR